MTKRLVKEIEKCVDCPYAGVNSSDECNLFNRVCFHPEVKGLVLMKGTWVEYQHGGYEAMMDRFHKIAIPKECPLPDKDQPSKMPVEETPEMRKTAKVMVEKLREIAKDHEHNRPSDGVVRAHLVHFNNNPCWGKYLDGDAECRRCYRAMECNRKGKLSGLTKLDSATVWGIDQSEPKGGG